MSETPRTPSLWERFLEWEEEAARQGSGMTEEQKTGAALLHSWIVNHAPEDALAHDRPSGSDVETETIDRLKRALRVATHQPHDQLGEPDEASGFPVCSVCGAIQTDVDRPSGSGLREALRIVEEAQAASQYWTARERIDDIANALRAALSEVTT